MTTAQQIFDFTMAMMDEADEATGATDTADTKEYKNRTLPILNILAGELYKYSDTYKVRAPGKRPIVMEIKDFNSLINLDDFICRSVMPYGLGAHLLLDENPNLAAFYQDRYEELLRKLVSGIPRDSEDIYDVYGPNGGLDPYNEFSSWK